MVFLSYLSNISLQIKLFETKFNANYASEHSTFERELEGTLLSAMNIHTYYMQCTICTYMHNYMHTYIQAYFRSCCSELY